MLIKLFKLPCRILLVLPSPFIGATAVCLGYFFYYLLPFRKKVIRLQIQKTVGRDMGKKEIRRLIIGNYIHYACVLFESVILFAADPAKSSYFDKHFTAPREDLLKKALEKGKGVILIGGHMGFWESIGAYCVRRFGPVTVAVKLMKSGIFQALREEMQSHPGIRMVDGRMGRQRIIALLQGLRNGELTGFFLDQYRPGEDFAPFLGQEARTNSTAALLWRKTRAPVILIHILRKKFGEYVIDIQEADPPDFPEIHDPRLHMLAINVYFNERIGQVVREHPEQWFWAHRRYKENPEFNYQ